MLNCFFSDLTFFHWSQKKEKMSFRHFCCSTFFPITVSTTEPSDCWYLWRSRQILSIFRGTDVTILDQCCPPPKVNQFGDTCESKPKTNSRSNISISYLQSKMTWLWASSMPPSSYRTTSAGSRRRRRPRLPQRLPRTSQQYFRWWYQLVTNSLLKKIRSTLYFFFKYTIFF